MATSFTFRDRDGKTLSISHDGPVDILLTPKVWRRDRENYRMVTVQTVVDFAEDPGPENEVCYSEIAHVTGWHGKGFMVRVKSREDESEPVFAFRSSSKVFYLQDYDDDSTAYSDAMTWATEKIAHYYEMNQKNY